MNSQSGISIANNSLFNTIGWIWGSIFFSIGTINTFWGNDPGFGVFIVLLSLVYFPPVHSIIKQKIGWSISWYVKLLLGIFILWASLGVGELLAKVDMMRSGLAI